MPTLNAFINLLGSLISFAGFLIAGFALGRFTLDAYRKAAWQVQIALALGFFALLAALTNYATSDLAGAFALGSGSAFLADQSPKKGTGNQVE